MNPFFKLCSKGVRGVIWFDFEFKSHLNRNIKKHAVWFSLVGFLNENLTKPT